MSKNKLIPKFVLDMDWALFKQQRQFLSDIQQGVPITSDEITDMSEGLCNLCDAIIDYAIDEIGIPEEEVLLNQQD